MNARIPVTLTIDNCLGMMGPKNCWATTRIVDIHFFSFAMTNASHANFNESMHVV